MLRHNSSSSALHKLPLIIWKENQTKLGWSQILCLDKRHKKTSFGSAQVNLVSIYVVYHKKFQLTVTIKKWIFSTSRDIPKVQLCRFYFVGKGRQNLKTPCIITYWYGWHTLLYINCQVNLWQPFDLKLLHSVSQTNTTCTKICF